jgi:hypothetical protein
MYVGIFNYRDIGNNFNTEYVSSENNFVPLESIWHLAKDVSESMEKKLGVFNIPMSQDLTSARSRLCDQLSVDTELLNIEKMREIKNLFDSRHSFFTDNRRLGVEGRTKYARTLYGYHFMIIETILRCIELGYPLRIHLPKQRNYNTDYSETSFKAGYGYSEEYHFKFRNSNKRLSSSMYKITELDPIEETDKILSMVVVKREWIPNVILCMILNQDINENALGIIEDPSFDNKDFFHKGVRTWYRRKKKEMGLACIQLENIMDVVLHNGKEICFDSLEEMQVYEKEIGTEFMSYLKQTELIKDGHSQMQMGRTLGLYTEFTIDAELPL